MGGCYCEVAQCHLTVSQLMDMVMSMLLPRVKLLILA